MMDFLWRVWSDLCGSDHFPIILNCEGSSPVERERSWRLCQADRPVFKTLSHEKFTPNISAVDSFTEMLRWIAQKTVPKTSAAPKRLTPPWLDDSCQRAIKERKKVQHRFHRRPTDENLMLFRILQAHAQRTIKEAWRWCWRRFISGITMGTPLGKVWTMIRRIK